MGAFVTSHDYQFINRDAVGEDSQVVTNGAMVLRARLAFDKMAAWSTLDAVAVAECWQELVPHATDYGSALEYVRQVQRRVETQGPTAERTALVMVTQKIWVASLPAQTDDDRAEEARRAA